MLGQEHVHKMECGMIRMGNPIVVVGRHVQDLLHVVHHKIGAMDGLHALTCAGLGVYIIMASLDHIIIAVKFFLEIQLCLMIFLIKLTGIY
jgi:hypothetical protein